MKVTKKILGTLKDCYSVQTLEIDGEINLLVASEAKDSCLMFDLNGVEKEKIWEKPGGTMAMIQIPNGNGNFLAIQQFNTFNDAENAEIVYVKKDENGKWIVETFLKIPYVHRFDILSRNGHNYIVICTLFSHRKNNEDWSSAGKVYVGNLPDDMSNLDGFKVELTVIINEIFRNHGYVRKDFDNIMCGVVTGDSGAYKIIPPIDKTHNWEIIKILDFPISDIAFCDFDSDGKDEILTISPFHGCDVNVYKNINGVYKNIYKHPKEMPFAHAIWGGKICNEPCVVIGYRDGLKELLLIKYVNNEFVTEIIDSNVGSSNVLHVIINGKDVIFSANRQINEIAMYTIE